MTRHRPLRSLTWWSVVLSSFLLAGCHTSDPTDPALDTTQETDASQSQDASVDSDAADVDGQTLPAGTFDASGGQLLLPHGGLLVVPPGSVDGEVELSVTKTAPADIPGVKTRGETWALSPPGATFDPPLTLFLPAPDGIESEGLAAFLSGDGDAWEALPVRLARASRTARIEVPHFSEIVLGESEACDLVVCLPDGDPCTADTCDMMTGACWRPVAQGTSCEADACTLGFTCTASGLCQGFAPLCDDGDPCTWDWCDPASGCTHSGGYIDDFVAPGGLFDGRHLRFGHDGRLFVADGPTDLVRIYDDQGLMVDFLVTDYPRSLDFDASWDLLVAGGSGWFSGGTEIVEFDVPDYDGSVIRLDWSDEDAEAAVMTLMDYPIFAGQFTTESLRIIGDTVFAAGIVSGQDGPPWVDRGWGGVIRLDRDGANPEVFAALPNPTALLATPNGSSLLVGRSTQSNGDTNVSDGDQALDNGAWANPGGVLLYDITTGDEEDPAMPEGGYPYFRDMAYGPGSGWVYVAHGDVVRRYALQGSGLALIDGYVTSTPTIARGIAFDDLGRLYVTAGDRIKRYVGDALGYDDGSACTNWDRCDGSGAATATPVPDTMVCVAADGDLGMCLSGVCVLADEACGVGEDPCVEVEARLADIAGYCDETPLTGPSCDDGDACTKLDACDAGVCTGMPVPCMDDANPCTNQGCDPAAGCTYEPVLDGTPCDDGDLCTFGGSCQSGICTSGPTACPEDGDPCTVPGCDPTSGCTQEPAPAGTVCDDGDGCTVNDLCVDGTCGGVALPCDDGDPCTVDLCDDLGGCTYEPLTGSACPGGTCLDGACVPDATGPIPALCVANEGGPPAVVCFDEATTVVRTLVTATVGGGCPAGCPAQVCPGPAGETCPEVTEASLSPSGASAITALGDALYVAADGLCHLLAMDLSADTWTSAPMCHSAAQDNINALGVWGDQLVMVGAAGSWAHLWDPTSGEVTGPIVSALNAPQGFALDPATGLGYVIDYSHITELTPQADGGYTAAVIHTPSAVDPAYVSEGGLVLHDGVLWYTDFGPNFGAGHLIALDLSTGLVTVVAEIPDNPRGLAVDPSGTWLYVSRYTTPSVDGGFAVGGSIDRLLISSAFDASPTVETWLSESPHLQGAFGMVWVTLPEP
jgi:hypothetical protein